MRPSYFFQNVAAALAVVAVSLVLAMPGRAATILVDFGSAGTITTNPADDPVNFWNNVTETGIGSTDNGQLLDLVTSTNAVTAIDLLMVRRFNGANLNGTTTSGLYPSDATSDSMYGNTEAFNGLSNIFPSFKLTSLDQSQSYTFSFYASRTGVSDNRETVYTVTGSSVGTATLNATNNTSTTVSVAGMRPNGAGEITISLAPSAANNNGNHFTYLGVMRVDSIPEPSTALVLVSGLGLIALRRRRP